MRKIVLFTLAASVVVLIPAAAQAEGVEVSGSAAMHTGHFFDDLFVSTTVPSVTAGVTVTKDNCSGAAWGLHAANPNDNRGWEVDLTASCDFQLAEKTSLNVTAERYLIAGPDITVAEASLTQTIDDKSSVTLTGTRYAVDGPAENANRIQVSYDRSLADSKFDLGVAATWETGFDSPDIVTAKASVTWHATDRLSLGVTGIVPVMKKDWDERKSRVMASITWSF
jgi:hypothetical protein